MPTLDDYKDFFAVLRKRTGIEALVGAVEKIVQLCDVWADRIRGILAGGKTPTADVPDAGPSLRLNP